MNKNWRLILDGECDGYYNMAVDEAMLCSYPELKTPTLRIYGWNKPFISIGYNQDKDAVLRPELKVPFVRRLTAGAAIFHKQEITYSITCSLEDLNFPREVKKTYEMLCEFIKEFYRRLGLKAQFAKDVFSENLGRYGNFCFSSREHFDLIINGKKIGGNAQRRRHNLIFQQGSIPQNLDFREIANSIFGADDLAEKTTFVNELTAKSIKFSELASLLALSFESAFGVNFTSRELVKKEKDTAFYLKAEKYATKEWNFSGKYTESNHRISAFLR